MSSLSSVSENVNGFLGSFEAFLDDPVSEIQSAHPAPNESTGWANAFATDLPKTRREERAAVSDQLFEALKQIYDLSEHELVDVKEVDRFLENICPAAIELCPAVDRQTFRAKISRLSRRGSPIKAVPESPVTAAASQPAPPDTHPTGNPSERRFALILAHVSGRLSAAGRESDERVTSLAQLISLAAEMAATKEDLRELIRRIPSSAQKAGENAFQVLSRGMASWDLTLDATAGTRETIRMMKKIITLCDDPTEWARLFRELVMAAVERLNDGAFCTAILMFDLAESVISEGMLHSTVINRIREDAGQAADAGRLDRFVDDTTRFPLLRKALGFFPSLAAEALVDQLQDERSPARRDMLRALLLIWGQQARRAALERLDREIDHEVKSDSVYLRELFNLLRGIGHEPGDDLRRELDILARASAPGKPVAMILGALSVIGDSRLLKQRLGEVVAIPFRSDRSYQVDEFYELLDATIAALARSGTPADLRAIAQHGLRQEPLLGDTRSRLRYLSDIDLLVDRETVTMLVNAVRAELPSRILGRVVTTRQTPNPTPIIEALRETSGQTVRLLLTEIASKYPQSDFGEAAVKMLHGRGRDRNQPAVAGSAAGDLVYFGLPRLIRSRVHCGATGVLSLTDASREVRGRMWFLSGELIAVEAGILRGSSAFYQLLERPVVGQYAFVTRQNQNGLPAGEPLDLPALLTEGMRRHDELQLLVAIVPDDGSFRATGTAPSREHQERDPNLLREVWVNASSGQPVKTWETTLVADPWRVRRIAARWVEDGSLESIPSLPAHKTAASQAATNSRSRRWDSLGSDPCLPVLNRDALNVG